MARLRTDTEVCSPSASLPRTHRITITNFCLGKHLVSEGDLLKDQRGSPAYISPDVLSGMFKVPGRGPEPHAARFCSHSYKQDLNQTVSVGGPGPGAGAQPQQTHGMSLRVWGPYP